MAKSVTKYRLDMLTPYQRWQYETKGDILSPYVEGDLDFEQNIEEEARYQEWIEFQAELRLREEDQR